MSLKYSYHSDFEISNIKKNTNIHLQQGISTASLSVWALLKWPDFQLMWWHHIGDCCQTSSTDLKLNSKAMLRMRWCSYSYQIDTSNIGKVNTGHFKFNLDKTRRKKELPISVLFIYKQLLK